MFSLMCAWLDEWVNNGQAGDFKRHRAHYDVTVIYGQIVFDVFLPVCRFDGARANHNGKLCIFQVNQKCSSAIKYFIQIIEHICRTFLFVRKAQNIPHPWPQYLTHPWNLWRKQFLIVEDIYCFFSVLISSCTADDKDSTISFVNMENSFERLREKVTISTRIKFGLISKDWWLGNFAPPILNLWSLSDKGRSRKMPKKRY